MAGGGKLLRGDRYAILGACNPVLADRALHTDLEIGLPFPVT